MRRDRRLERGGSTVVAVVALPLLLAFLFAAVDLGRVAYLGAEASTAAHGVCRRVAARPQAAVSRDELHAAALEASPSLSGEGLELSVTVDVGAAEERELAYRLHNGRGDGFASRSVAVRTRPVQATLSVRGRYLTPLGALLSQDGDNATFVCGARAEGSIDETAMGQGL